MDTDNSVIERALVDEQQTRETKNARKSGSVQRTARKGSVGSRLPLLIRISVRFFPVLLGPALLAYLVLRTGPRAVWHELGVVGWGLALIIVLGGVSQLVKTCAWRQALNCNIRGPSWSRSFVAQLISDGIGQFGVAGKVLGEGMRISLVRGTVPLPSALSAGAIDAGLHSFTAVLITVSGIAATLLVAPLSSTWRTYALLLVAALMSTAILGAVAVTKRWHLIGNALRASGRLPGIGKWITAKQPIIDSAEDSLLAFHDEAPAAFWASLICNLLWHVLAVLEVYVILRFMGTRIAVGGAFIVEGLTKVINLVGALNPGNFGTYEFGNMLIAKIFGVTSTAGLTLALCRRTRTVFWAGIGAICMMAMRRDEVTQPNRMENGSQSSAVEASPSQP